MSEQMIRVSRDNPCPVCGRPDWCLVAEDGSACICARISDGCVKKVGEAGHLHILTERTAPLRRRPKPKPQKQKPVPDFFKLAESMMRGTIGLLGLSETLGVSIDSLRRLQVGWMEKCWAFPMRDGYNKIVGIRLRSKTHKFAVKGSKNALFWPVGVKAEGDQILFICEGPTDTAALLDLGFDTIGRASCNTGLEYLKTAIGVHNREVVIMADKDEPKNRPDGSVFYPGYDGALRLAEGLKPVTANVRVIQPPHSKDIRSWYQSGATAAMVMNLVRNARFV